jgi:hypothetical protein
MSTRITVVIGLFATLLMTTACNFNNEPLTPTIEGFTEEPIEPLPDQTEDLLPTATLTPSPSSEATEVADVALEATSTPSETPIPSETPVPSPTPGPWEYVIQPNDTLLFIIRQPPFNYDIGDQAIIDAIVRLNDNIVSADFLPPPGETILIPRPTSAPLPANVPTADPEQVSQVTADGPNIVIDHEGVVIVQPDQPNVTMPPMRENKGLPAGSYVGCHMVRENETVAGIIEQYAGLRIDIFSRLNADLNYSGCDFDIPSGGPLCNPVIRANTCVNVVLPTPTPTPSPTPSGSETPTPTATFVAPRVIAPIDNSTVSGGVLTLSWVSSGVLDENETYLIQITDQTSGKTNNFTTRSTSYRLPSSLIPTDGQTHTFNWNVSVAYRNPDGLYVPVGGGTNRTMTFQWQSR